MLRAADEMSAKLTPQTAHEAPKGGSGGGKKRARVPRELSQAPNPETATLRHFSLKVCQVVESLGTTSYNEVADKLVSELLGDRVQDSSRDNDERNVRRRVYDALNVLEAMDIIVKEKKLVKWCGFPETNAGLHFLRQRQIDQSHQLEAKQQKLKSLIGQLVSYKQLIQRNREREQAANATPPSPTASAVAATASVCAPFSTISSSANDDPDREGASAADGAREMGGNDALSCGPRPMPPALVATPSAASSTPDERASMPCSSSGGGESSGGEHASRKLSMPFLLVATQTPTYVDCAMASDQNRALLTFQHQFSIHDDSEVLRCLGLHMPSTDEMLSQLLSPELVAFANGQGGLPSPPAATPHQPS